MVREHPLKKIYNIIDYRDLNTGGIDVPSFPRIIELEVTNYCNFQCRMCKTGSGSSKRPKGFMDKDIFKKLINEVKDYQCAVKFVGWGEPTLHAEFLNFVKIAKEAGLICHLTTNGSMMTADFSKKVIESGLDSVKFSFQGVDSSGYFDIRRRTDFDALMGRIEELYRIRGDKDNPYITIGTSVLEETSEQIEMFREKYQRICDKLEVGNTSLQYVETDLITDDDKLKERFCRIKEAQKSFLKRPACCTQVFDVVAIHWDGNICACCNDCEEEMLLGNLKDNTIKECWNGKKEDMFRRILFEKAWDKLPLCKNCYDMWEWTHRK